MACRNPGAASGQANAFTPQSPWLDLVNSEMWDGFGRHTDHLCEPRWAREFLKRCRIDANALDPGEAHAQLKALRHFLREAAQKVAATGAMDRQGVAKLNAFLEARGRLQVSLKDKMLTTAFEPLRRDWKWVEGRICLSYIEALQNSVRIKICPNTGCNWAFFDRTKGNIRKWCNDRACGNRDRVRRARARQG